MKASRASLLASLASAYATICIPRRPAGAAEFTYKISTSVPATDPMTSRVLEAAVKINHDTNGRFELQVYPNLTLGSESASLEQVRVGAIEFYQAGNPASLSSLVPASALDSLPFIFAGHEDAWHADDGALGQYIRAQISKAGMYPMATIWSSSFRQVENNIRSISSPDDMHGLKIRIVPGVVAIALFKALGATPTPIDYRELYSALQTHVVDGVDLPWVTAEANKFYEVVKYGSGTNHSYIGLTMLANATAWGRLPANIRDAVERNLNAAGVKERQDMKAADSVSLAKLRQQGLVYNETNHAAFQDTLKRAGLYAQWRTQFGDGWTALVKSVPSLG